MFIARSDATVGEPEWQTFVESHPFGHLIAPGDRSARDLPVVVPTQFVFEGQTVWLHLVRANPIFAALAENSQVLLSVAGDWAFIPSAWKAIGTEDPLLGIPTTYYAAVQFTGRATVLDERESPGSVAGILRRQLARLQPEVPVADPSDAHSAKLQGILGISIAVEEVTAKFKYGGNVDGTHRLAVVERLRERDAPGDAAAAEHVLRRLRSEENRDADPAGPNEA
jgi:transcriptional regulator